MPKHVAVYPGSFDPITFGHLDVIARGRKLFDELIVAVGRNPGKDPLFTDEERVDLAQRLIAEMVRKNPHDAPVTVRVFSGLTVDFARDVGANVLLRGVRNLSDLQNEVQQAVTNREVAAGGRVEIRASLGLRGRREQARHDRHGDKGRQRRQQFGRQVSQQVFQESS